MHFNFPLFFREDKGNGLRRVSDRKEREVDL